MLPWDPQGKMGPKKPLPDHVSIVEPKEEVIPSQPFSEAKVPQCRCEGPMSAVLTLYTLRQAASDIKELYLACRANKHMHL